MRNTRLARWWRLHTNARATLAALDALVSMCEVHGDFSNGVTDPTGSIDEGVIRASELIRAGRAAIDSAMNTKGAEE